MKRLIPNTLFVRLFLLLFVILSLSHFVGITIASNLDYARVENGSHPTPEMRLFWTFMRLAGTALTAWIAARWLSAPIKRLALAAGELGKNLERAPLDESSGPTEVRQASVVFNQMQGRLLLQIAERNRFLAAVSHDLRTPLTRLKLRAEKIDSEALKSEIRNDLNEMSAMIDATLDYLRGDSHPESFCLLDIDALLHSLAEDAEEQGNKVIVNGSAKPIMAQPVALRRCLNNLVENAVRYGNYADITLLDFSDRLLISIHDAGPGLSEDQLEAVFAPFYRLESSRSRHTGGVGLGLSIAREVAHKHGGTLALHNAPTGGLVAELRLPRQSADSTA